MSFKITVELNSADIIERRLGINTNGRAQLFLANETYRRQSKYVPFKTGALRDTVDVRADGIDYLVPYARRQYYENRGMGIRGKFWDKRMLSAEGSQLYQDLENYIRRG
jgi:hypothetical protein